MHILILGPAGSGKTLLIDRFGQLLARDNAVRYMNLDPGAEEIPYQPDFDVRTHYTLRQVMLAEGLGLNGAMLRAIDKLADLEIPSYNADFILVDTPGQLEPFVFRNAGSIITGKLPDCSCIYIMDSSSSIQTLPSLFLYSLAAQFSLGAPVANVMNKVDVLGRGRDEITKLLTSPRTFLGTRPNGLRWEINTEIAAIMERFLPAQRPCLVSAKTGKGFDQPLDMMNEIKCACGDLT